MAPFSGGVDERCTTHHSCDCRTARMEALEQELTAIRESWESWNRGHNRMTDADTLREIGLLLDGNS